jgi:hypothetical protein
MEPSDKLNNDRERILDIVKTKSVLKQDVFAETKEAFAVFRKALQETIDYLRQKFAGLDERVTFDYKESGDFQVEIKVAGDVLIFFMHTNVFQVEKTHSLWKSSYFSEDESRSYVGIINVYNFLADSLKYQRVQDLGYLVGRILINKDKHFMLQGKRQMGIMYNNLLDQELGESQIRDIVNTIILYTLNFDLLTPPFQAIEEVSVSDMQVMTHQLNVATGKRLGFRFRHEEGDIS